jgi:ribosomal protein S18 acetylase RimI-like enzyme
MSAEPLRWRAPTVDDADAWAGLIAAMETVDKLGEMYSAEELAEELTSPGVDPAVDGRLGFAGDGELVAFGLVAGRPATETIDLHRVQLWGGLHPEWRGRGIGRELLGWMTQHGEAKHRTDHPDVEGLLEVACAEQEATKVAMLERAGFTPLRYWYDMVCDLRTAEIDAPEIPPGLTIERYRPELADATRAAHNEAFADHWGSTPASAERWQHSYVGQSTFRPDLSFVVVDGDDVVAYLLTVVYPQDDVVRGGPHGWISHLGSRRSHRGKGLATSLLQTACRAYRDLGFIEALLGVDVENPSGALGFYERFGFTVDGRRTSYGRPIV